MGPAVALRVDADAFRVVFENLLDNARKYGGASVTLSTSVVDGKWRLAVSDSGIGFDPAEAADLFDPFSRHDKRGVTTHGSGLGLYLSRQLALDMHGNLSAVSEGPGRGSTFYFDIPVAPGGADAAKEKLARA
jgi:signal transduction histidine kinase